MLANTSRDRDRIRREIEQEVRFANITIIEGIGPSQYGIGMVCARITELVFPAAGTIATLVALAAIAMGCDRGHR